MPIYEYVCDSCQFKFEELRPLSKAGEDVICPQCQQKARRVLSTFACRTTDEHGFATALGNSCGSCAADSCSSCSH